ncbi:L-type lectin-domain containing receptor kinase SIT2 isoform X2 [Cryptomeria japonica]|uniref:L-type lectin-domain containing receptor kinase SIT2 isoform X2 n=1 Tax=Cryptomeria japonica TaxID=3369 RepID=UPI0025AC088B|nr:L-type lectin-domain containing receptor kinase SIT2 isoform X2 [Cryptomeria japonica]
MGFWYLLLLFAVVKTAAQESANNQTQTTFVFHNFTATSKVTLIQSAVINSPVVRLTNDTQWIIGRVFYPHPVQMKRNSSLSSFSTSFVMAIVPPEGAAGTGHGLAFVMAPSPDLIGAQPSVYLGLLNNTSNGQQYNHLFAVEFDTSQSVDFQDPSANHVGLDLNSLNSLDIPPDAGYWDGQNFVNVTLKSGRNIQVWIDYDHIQDQINVTMTLAGMSKPQKPLISRMNVNLSAVLQDQVYVGFSSATGNFVAEHYILAWSFTTNGTAPNLDVSNLPSLMWKKKPLYKTKGFIAIITLVSFLIPLAGALFLLKRYRDREIIEEWELEFWPHRFSYRELKIATKGFAEVEVLGSGGFGRVYRGVLPASGQEIAVKCVNKEVREGIKEFVAEITSMGRLQHRNLVQLRGWCRNKKRLFIVYDYMPNGSLDKMIFEKNTFLNWGQRYTILKGVAAGLLYLHEQWEKRVVHRDIKSSNVLLDVEMNGRLGDFGLARLYDHSENPGTTHVVGTLGYIAPELLYSGKATPATDVFSFGVVLLEVACGRKPVDPSKDDSEAILVDWMWELYSQEKIMDAVDPRLRGDYDIEEMERVLYLGLFCCHPQGEKRLTIRHVLQILEGEADLPVLNMPSFNSSILGSTPKSGFFTGTSYGSSNPNSMTSQDNLFSSTNSRRQQEMKSLL